MEYGIKANANEADKIVGKLALCEDESAVFAGTCNNWTPVSVDRIVITNMRLIGTQAMPVKVTWEAPLSEIARATQDPTKKSLTVAKADGEIFTFKKVPAEDYAKIIGFLNVEGAPLPDPITDGEAPTVAKKESAFAKFGAAVKQKAVEVQADMQEKAAKDAEAQEAAKAAAGNVVHKGTYSGTVVWVYSGGYVRFNDGLTRWEMPDSAKFERLLSVQFTTMTRDKSAGGRAIGAVASGGLSVFASGERIESFVSVATDRKVHKLGCTRAAGVALEAAGKGVVEAAHGAATQPVAVTQAAAGLTVAEQLRQLADLHKDGILTDEEFAAKRAVLLDRL